MSTESTKGNERLKSNELTAEQVNSLVITRKVFQEATAKDDHLKNLNVTGTLGNILFEQGIYETYKAFETILENEDLTEIAIKVANMQDAQEWIEGGDFQTWLSRSSSRIDASNFRTDHDKSVIEEIKSSYYNISELFYNTEILVLYKKGLLKTPENRKKSIPLEKRKSNAERVILGTNIKEPLKNIIMEFYTYIYTEKDTRLDITKLFDQMSYGRDYDYISNSCQLKTKLL